MPLVLPEVASLRTSLDKLSCSFSSLAFFASNRAGSIDPGPVSTGGNANFHPVSLAGCLDLRLLQSAQPGQPVDALRPGYGRAYAGQPGVRLALVGEDQWPNDRGLSRRYGQAATGNGYGMNGLEDMVVVDGWR